MYSVKAIILKNVPFGENQRIIHAFSAEKGYLSFITPDTTLRKKQPYASQCMQVTEITYLENCRGGLHKLKSSQPLLNTSAIYFDVYKMNIALLWGEILNLILRHEEKNELLYAFIEQSVEYLNAAKEGYANFNLFFFYKLCILLGFRIDTGSYRPGYVFNINDGRFYPPEEILSYTAGPHTAKVIYQLCSVPLHQIGDVPLNGESRRILLDVVLMFLGFHLNMNFNNKQIQIIRDVFR